MAFQQTMLMSSDQAPGAFGPPGGAPAGGPPGGAFGAGTPPPGGGFGAPAGGGGPAFGAPPGGGGFGAPPPGGPQGFGAPPMAAAQPPKKSKTGMYIGIACAGLFLFCCVPSGLYWFFAVRAASDAIDEANDNLQQAQEAAQQAQEAAGDTTGTAGGGGVCNRAADCCRAYVQEMGGGPAMAAVEASCANYSNMPVGSDVGCQSAIDGWRSGLTAMGRTVPAACQ